MNFHVLLKNTRPIHVTAISVFKRNVKGLKSIGCKNRHLNAILKTILE